MKYISTRGSAPELGFQDTILAGLARDGGLYVPKSWPQIGVDEIRSMAGKPYNQIAKTILAPFVEDEIDSNDLERMINDAYTTFHHQAIVPLVQLGPNHFVAELFHGPTLAFKDVAMQLLARLMDHVLYQNGERATIVAATSGDTGGAAIEAFRGRDNVDIFVLFPHGKVSPVQQKQMTTVDAKNVHAIAIDGNFDDCQSLVKAIFNHHSFRDEVKIAGVNSINWARILAQIVYYFSTASSLGSPDRDISFTVPTANFGDIFAGFSAKKMGLPIKRLIIATNQNDILARTLESGRYEVRDVRPSTSPSMDIQVSSNFERLLFEAEARSSEAVCRMMSGLSQSGTFVLSEQALEFISQSFGAGRSNEEMTAQTIRHTLSASNYLLDPHTACGVGVANEKIEQAGMENSVMITLSTAHPAKFPEAVHNASGIDAALPDWTSDFMQREESYVRMDNDLEKLEIFIREHSRAV
ncbi:MAG: threonine synthase [Hyphomicrobiales bacterium]|nr:threonine synthase [Hyphomicrobiales bacterium]